MTQIIILKESRKFELYPIKKKIIGGFPGGSAVKKSPVNAENEGSIPGLGRSLRKGNGNLLQYSYLGNPMDRGTWWATVHGVAKEWDMT